MHKYTAVPFNKVTLSSNFWSERQKINREVTLYSVLKRFSETGRFSAFNFDWEEGMPNKPHFFYESDVAKWIEGAAYILKREQNKEIEKTIDETIDLIEKHQDTNGYFNVWFTVIEPDKRFTDRTAHELYCAGHLFEAAIAYHEATGKDKFLRLMCKYADHIADVFMIKQSAAFLTPGHQEIELALIRLYRHTGIERYRELSRWFLSQRGKNDKDTFQTWANAEYAQDHLPVALQNTAAGHAVRACYQYCAMADIAYEYDDRQMFEAAQTIFRDIIESKMYITGGIGSSRNGETFTKAYDLPNHTAYAETCAAISLAMFACRMQLLTGDSIYPDVIETIIYNGFLSGVSLDGRSFFYENPLEVDLAQRGRESAVLQPEVLPAVTRAEVFDCSCCPPNILRFIESLGGYIYSYDENNIFIHQYIAGAAGFAVSNRNIIIRQNTDYPAGECVQIKIEYAANLTVNVRIPGWCKDYEIYADGGVIKTDKFNNSAVQNGYIPVRCTDNNVTISLTLKMPVELIEADPAVHSNTGKAALRCGPIVYCVEGHDNNNAVHDILLPSNFSAEFTEIPGIPLPCIKIPGYKRTGFGGGALYRPYKKDLTPHDIVFIPYFSFANRGEQNMLVWLPLSTP